jgi:hypothetical protein
MKSQMKQKTKVQHKRLRAGYRSAQTPYENLINSLRHAYDKIPGVETNSEKEEENDSWLSRLAAQ